MGNLCRRLKIILTLPTAVSVEMSHKGPFFTYAKVSSVDQLWSSLAVISQFYLQIKQQLRHFAFRLTGGGGPKRPKKRPYFKNAS